MCSLTHQTLSIGWVMDCWGQRKDSKTAIKTGLLGGLTYKESRNGWANREPTAGIYMQQVFYYSNYSQRFEGDQALPHGYPSLQWRHSGLATPRALDLEHRTTHSATHSAWWSIKGGQDLSIFKIVFNKDIQSVLAQTSYPVCALEVANLKSSTLSIHGH